MKFNLVYRKCKFMTQYVFSWRLIYHHAYGKNYRKMVIDYIGWHLAINECHHRQVLAVNKQK